MTVGKFTITLAKFTLTQASKSIITAPIILKFHMHHDKAAGLQGDQLQPAGESKMAAVAKNS